MKKVAALLLFTFSFFISGAQTNVNADCIDAIPLCNTPSFTFFPTSGPGNVNDIPNNSNISNPVNDPFPPDFGCLQSGELNPQWLIITIGNPGTLEFVFGGANSPNPQTGCYDWSMWPYNPNTCAQIQNNTLPPVRCNWNSPCSGGTGIASDANVALIGGNVMNFGEPLQVKMCQQFIICISNFSNVDTKVSFQSIGTASLACDPKCKPSYTICAGAQTTVVPINTAGLTNETYSMNPGGLTSSNGSFVVNPTSTTIYTTYISGTNLSNVPEVTISSATVVVNKQPIVAPSVTQTSCFDSITKVNLGLTWNPGFPAPGYTVTWSSIPDPVATPTDVIFSGITTAGVYNATISTAAGCSATASFTVNPQPQLPQIILSPNATQYTVTCREPVIDLSLLEPTNNYTWTNGLIAPRTGTFVQMTFTTLGTWSIIAVHPVSKCVVTKTISVSQSTNAPTSTVSPNTQLITCSITSIQTVTATVSPTVNVSHQIMAPQGGTYAATSNTLIYLPGGVGIFTHCAVNDINGCSTCKQFTVSSNQGFPTFSVVSPQNFSLGCNSTSIANINIIGASATNSLQIPNGGPVSYTIIGPPTSTSTPNGTLSAASNYTVNAPGSWTVITKDNNSFCETRVPISILQNTFSPAISAIIPMQVLNCYQPKMTMRGVSSTKNVSYSWSFPGNPGVQPGDTIPVKISNVPTNSLIATYTLTITDNSSTCRSTSVIPIYQNTFPPKATIVASTPTLSCKIPTITLTNQSNSTVPPNIGLPPGGPAIGYLWTGPTPQIPSQVSTTYLARIAGVYTMTVRDNSNGCYSKTTYSLIDGKIYPVVNNPVAGGPFELDCGTDPVVAIYPIVTQPATGLDYSWQVPQGAVISTVTSNQPTLTVKNIGTYRVRVTYSVSGCATTADIKVTPAKLSGDIKLDKEQGFAPLTVNFTDASATTLTNTGIVSAWSFGNGKDTVTKTPGAKYKTTYHQPGTYTITVFQVKGFCRDTVVKTVRVDIPSAIEIPNVFTPNGDGVNDEFFVKAINLSEISISIVDRWGHLVYELDSTTGNILWNGKNQIGVQVAEGTYFYTLKAKGTDGEEYDQNGTITVTR